MFGSLTAEWALGIDKMWKNYPGRHYAHLIAIQTIKTIEIIVLDISEMRI